MVDRIAEYVAQRAAKPLDIGQGLTAALDQLAAAGAALDTVLVQAERVKAIVSRADAARFEETVQTLGALSREAWTAHHATLAVLAGLRQLDDVEGRLSTAASDS